MHEFRIMLYLLVSPPAEKCTTCGLWLVARQVLAAQARRCLASALGKAMGLGSTSSPRHPCSASNRRLLEACSKSWAPASMKNPSLTCFLKMTLSR